MKKNIIVIIVECIILIILHFVFNYYKAPSKSMKCSSAFNCKTINGKFMCNYMDDDNKVAKDKVECYEVIK